MDGDFSGLWSQVLDELQNHMSKPSFDSWLADSTASLQDGRLRVIVPDQFGRDWLESNYTELVQQIASQFAGESLRVTFEAVPAGSAKTPVSEYMRELVETVDAPVETRTAPVATVSSEFSSLPLNEAYRFETFVTGASNQFARATAESVAQQPGNVYNPLFIYGGIGLGKTHLLHAIGHLAREKHPGLNVMYISGETFLYHYVSAIRDGRSAEFRKAYRHVDLWLVDDIQLIAERQATRTEQEFFNTFNELYGTNKQIVITSDAPPKDLHFSHPRLTSRFEWGLVCDIAPPEFETRVAILQRKAGDFGSQISQEVYEYIARMIPANVRVLEGALKKLIAYCLHFGCAPTLKVAKTIVAPYSTDTGLSVVTVDKLKLVVAEHFGVSVEDLVGPSRAKAVSFPRQIAMFLARGMTNLSLPAIGKAFGGRDHTTVMYAISKIESSMGENQQLSNLLEELRQKVRQP